MFVKGMLYEDILDLANQYARVTSGCTKVHVGSVIINEKGDIVSFGANRTFPNLCKARGCMRIEKYGDNSKSHRNPEDCRALHSEIDAICNARESLSGAKIYITRYPCEACARAIAAAGISEIIYGRQQKISDETEHIFANSHVDVTWMDNWIEEDTNI
ncbi:MAG: deaminase [Niameybacter sp.]